MKDKVNKAYLLTASGHKSVKVTQQNGRVSVTLPAEAPVQIASVVVLETK